MNWPEILPWVIFNALVLAMLALDLLINRHAHVIKFKEAALWSLFWIFLALAFNLHIYYSRGPESALNFFTGYLIEKALSVDNLFVFLLIFKYFHTPRDLMHKALFWGVLGAIVMRALYIWLGIVLIEQFHWMFYLFGLILIYSGIKLGLEKDKEIHPEKNWVIKFFHSFMPTTHEYYGDKFFIKKMGKTYATPLFIVLLAIESADLIFAIDSIPAILAITQDPYIVYTSNIFAILGLRSLYFVLSHMMEAFHYLHYALSFILVFIGLKMILDDFYTINNFAALGVVLVALLVAIAASLLLKK